MKIILDIEANGLRPDTIWVIVAKEIGNDGTNSVFLADEIGRFGDWCRDNDVSCIIGHNVLGYDIPVMERLIPNFKWEGEVEDTLVMSRLANPQREGGHSLASWGDRLLFPKGEHSEWDKFSWEMVEYCQRDVDVTLKTYEQLKIELDGFSS